MEEQEIPRNVRPEFCDNPTVSPIEFNRNSSLIANKSHVFNISYENYCIDDDIEEKNQFLENNEKIAPKESLLDLRFIDNDYSLDFSYDDSEFFQELEPCSYSSIEESLNKKIDLNESLPSMDYSLNEKKANRCKRKSQSYIYKEAYKKRRSERNLLPTDPNLLPNPIQVFQMDEDGYNGDIESVSLAGSSLLFDSFSINESMVLSPIAHEMSHLNGKELKDVSNFFQCDMSSFEKEMTN